MISTFAGRWRSAVAAAPDRPFLLWEGPDERVTTWTYGEFDALVERTAARLVAEGAGPGSAVHLLLANSPAFVATWLAAMRLGAWIVPADPSARAHELCDQFQRTRPAVIVAGVDRVATAIAARDQVHASGCVVAVAEDDTELAEFAPARAAAVQHRLPRADARAAVMFTSGTTSRPKGVEI